MMTTAVTDWAIRQKGKGLCIKCRATAVRCNMCEAHYQHRLRYNRKYSRTHNHNRIAAGRLPQPEDIARICRYCDAPAVDGSTLCRLHYMTAVGNKEKHNQQWRVAQDLRLTRQLGLKCFEDDEPWCLVQTEPKSLAVVEWYGWDWVSVPVTPGTRR